MTASKQTNNPADIYAIDRIVVLYTMKDYRTTAHALMP